MDGAIGQQWKTPPTSGSEAVETVGSIKLPPITVSLERRVKVGFKCGIAGGIVNRERGISRNLAPGIIMQRGALQPTSCTRLWNISNPELSLQICSLSTSPRLPCQI